MLYIYIHTVNILSAMARPGASILLYIYIYIL